MTEKKIASSAFSFCKRCVGTTSCLVWEIEPRKLGTILSIQVSSSGKKKLPQQHRYEVFFSSLILNHWRGTAVILRNYLWYLRDLEWLRQDKWTWKKYVPRLQRFKQCSAHVETMLQTRKSWTVLKALSVFMDPWEKHNVPRLKFETGDLKLKHNG